MMIYLAPTSSTCLSRREAAFALEHGPFELQGLEAVRQSAFPAPFRLGEPLREQLRQGEELSGRERLGATQDEA